MVDGGRVIHQEHKREDQLNEDYFTTPGFYKDSDIPTVLVTRHYTRATWAELSEYKPKPGVLFGVHVHNWLAVCDRVVSTTMTHDVVSVKLLNTSECLRLAVTLDLDGAATWHTWKCRRTRYPTTWKCSVYAKSTDTSLIGTIQAVGGQAPKASSTYLDNLNAPTLHTRRVNSWRILDA